MDYLISMSYEGITPTCSIVFNCGAQREPGGPDLTIPPPPCSFACIYFCVMLL
jgi:hypothetical protein